MEMGCGFNGGYDMHLNSDNHAHDPIVYVVSKNLPQDTKMTSINTGLSSKHAEKNCFDQRWRLRGGSYPQDSPSSCDATLNDVSHSISKKKPGYMKEDPLPIHHHASRGVSDNHYKHETITEQFRTFELLGQGSEDAPFRSRPRHYCNSRRHSVSPELVTAQSPLRLPDILQSRCAPCVTAPAKVKENRRNSSSGGEGGSEDPSPHLQRHLPRGDRPLFFTRPKRDNRLSPARPLPTNQKSSPLSEGVRELHSGHDLSAVSTSTTDPETTPEMWKAKHTDTMLRFRRLSKDGGLLHRPPHTLGLKNTHAPPLNLKLLGCTDSSTESSCKGEVDKSGLPLDLERSPKPAQQRRFHCFHSIVPKMEPLDDKNKETDTSGTSAVALPSDCASTSGSILTALQYPMAPSQPDSQGNLNSKNMVSKLDSKGNPCRDTSNLVDYGHSRSVSLCDRMHSLGMSDYLQYSYTMLAGVAASEQESAVTADQKPLQGTAPLHPSCMRDMLNEWQNNVQVLSLQPNRMCGGDSSRKYLQHQWYPRPQPGHVKPEVAGESIELNEQLHNDIIHLIQKRRALVLEYPSKLPCELDEVVRHRRPRTPRSFYGPLKPQVGKNWYSSAMKDVQRVPSPDFSSLEKDDAIPKRGGHAEERM